MTPGHGTDAPPPRRSDARRNRERLVDAARETFAEFGPGASLNEIARRADVGPGTLYRHFPHRQALLTAVLRDRVEALCAKAEELRTSDQVTPDEALAQWTQAFLTHARDQQGIGSALLVEGGEELGIDCHRMIQDAANGVLARAQRHGTARPDLAAPDLVRLVTGIALSTVPGDGPQRAPRAPQPPRTSQPGQAARAQQAEQSEQAERLLELVLDAVHAGPRHDGPPR
ncbi:TetR/AcrR family transcriptional regulator [Streptomyces sp. NPDC004111]|uniref:TetR/AcrR family transcriptional regulator n=1 Tax=Streptomyces sp. NPDC004111 TaxID=3364690 RepID=UPI0036A79CF9